MAKTVAAAGRYPYGICGFLIQGAVLKDGTIIKDARIQKQRNSYDFDIRGNDGTIYPSLRITGLNKQGTLLDYNLSDDDIPLNLKPGQFYVRSMNEQGDHGFAIKFFDNKVILADGRHLYNLVPPTCSLPKPPLGTIVFDRINEGDMVLSGTILPYSSAGLNTEGMTVTVLINGIEYTADVNPDGSFSIPVPALSSGTYVVTVKSDFYQSTNGTVNVIGDDDNVLSFFIPQSSFVKQSDDSYSAVLSGSTHGETDFIIQTQYSSGQVYTPRVSYNNTSHDITLNQITPTDTNVLLLTNDLYVKTVSTSDWVDQNGYYTLSIPQSEHTKSSNLVVQVSESTDSDVYEVSHESISIDSSGTISISVIQPIDARVLVSGN